MNREFEYIIKTLKNIKLKEAEKLKMRARVFEALGDVTNPKENRLYYHYQFFKSYNFMLNKNKFASVFAVVLIAALTGGVSAFAEKAVPGDLLYGVKVSINEPVAGVFALTKEDKTEWQERLIERRLEEAQKLVSRDNLDENVRISLENKIQTKIDEFTANESVHSSDLNIRLQASLRAHQNVLERLRGETITGENTKQETGKLLSSIEGFKVKVKDDHKDFESNNNTDNNAETAENALNSVKLLYQKEKINLSANIRSQIDSKLSLAETMLTEGKFQSVINLANAAKLLMLSNIIKDDIEDDMDIESEDDSDIEEETEELDDNDDENEDNKTDDENEIEIEDEFELEID